jgi:hypothetical protein
LGWGFRYRARFEEQEISNEFSAPGHAERSVKKLTWDWDWTASDSTVVALKQIRANTVPSNGPVVSFFIVFGAEPEAVHVGK